MNWNNHVFRKIKYNIDGYRKLTVQKIFFEYWIKFNFVYRRPRSTNVIDNED